MDAQSPSKRYTRGIHLHGEHSVEQPSFFLGLTQNFGEVPGSMSKSNVMQEIRSKLKKDPIRLEEMSAKSKQANIRIVEGGKKICLMLGQVKKGKKKKTNYTDDNAKRKEVVVSGSLEHDENLSPTPMELKILELPPEYVRLDQFPTKISAANDSDDDFQDTPRPNNNKGKEKVNTCSSPPKKKSRQTITPIQKKTPPMIISKHPLRKSPQHANVPKRPKSPLSKRQAKQCANVTFSIGIKQNVEIKSSVASEIPSTNKSPDFKVSIHQSPLQSPAGHSEFIPLGQQFNTPEPQVPITFEVQNTSEFPNIFEVQNTFEKEDCQNVKEGSQFMNDQAYFNNSSFAYGKKEFTDTNKSGSFDANKLIVEQVFMCPTPLQMVHDDQSNLNPERSMVLHPLLAVDEHTPLPIPRERRPGPFNTSPYKGQRRAIQKEKVVLQMWFHFGIVTVQNKNWFYKLAYKDQLLDDSYIDVILYYIRKPSTPTTTHSVLSLNINKDSTEKSILEYINGYRMHVAAPWHTVDNILIHKKDIDMSSHPKYKSHSEFDSFEMIYVKDIPQQTEGSLDCRLYVAAYADHISNRNVVLKSFDSEFTRIRYAALLWNEKDPSQCH
ncbi:hypothetical protein KY284_034498 [Solanum tuberosum]|nr:hypothetical protein KY284_034498 [Solanum tuberosum]